MCGRCSPLCVGHMGNVSSPGFHLHGWSGPRDVLRQVPAGGVTVWVSEAEPTGDTRAGSAQWRLRDLDRGGNT